MKTIGGLLFGVLMAASVLAQGKPTSTKAPPFHVPDESEECRLTWKVSTHPLPRGWETLDPVKVRGFLNACVRHDPERRSVSILQSASVVGGQLFFYGSESQQAAVAELLAALGGFKESEPKRILWPVPFTITAEERKQYVLTPGRVKLEEMLDENLGPAVHLESVAKILSYRKDKQELPVAVHPDLQAKDVGTSSGTGVTLRACLDAYARGIGGRLAVRDEMVVIEPWPKTNTTHADWPTFGAEVRSYPLRLPKGVTTADVERLLYDLTAFMDGKDYAALVLPDRVVAVTLDTFESHPRIAELLEKLEKKEPK